MRECGECRARNNLRGQFAAGSCRGWGSGVVAGWASMIGVFWLRLGLRVGCVRARPRHGFGGREMQPPRHRDTEIAPRRDAREARAPPRAVSPNKARHAAPKVRGIALQRGAESYWPLADALPGRAGRLLGRAGRLLGRPGRLLGRAGRLLGRAGRLSGRPGRLLGRAGGLPGRAGKLPASARRPRQAVLSNAEWRMPRLSRMPNAASSLAIWLFGNLAICWRSRRIHRGTSGHLQHSQQHQPDRQPREVVPQLPPKVVAVGVEGGLCVRLGSCHGGRAHPFPIVGTA